MPDNDITQNDATLPSVSSSSTVLQRSMDRNALRRLMTERLGRTDISVLWFELFGTTLDSELPGRSLSECVIELLERVDKKLMIDALFDKLEHYYPHLLIADEDVMRLLQLGGISNLSGEGRDRNSDGTNVITEAHEQASQSRINWTLLVLGIVLVIGFVGIAVYTGRNKITPIQLVMRAFHNDDGVEKMTKLRNKVKTVHVNLKYFDSKKPNTFYRKRDVITDSKNIIDEYHQIERDDLPSLWLKIEWYQRISELNAFLVAIYIEDEKASNLAIKYAEEEVKFARKGIELGEVMQDRKPANGRYTDEDREFYLGGNKPTEEQILLWNVADGLAATAYRTKRQDDINAAIEAYNKIKDYYQDDFSVPMDWLRENYIK